ncbi:SNF2 family domain-containing protein [Colletotrichum scovillei]|uniref:SNF2 family domain-containing protein n=1 Tax=Colletotrichum scovillei TaxID=1209932 RepID=A0A9P7QSN4_9PEZI|nr:SNF2 family domain-containing protein [Colletotrichum scovillei]KAF4778400.1 SNF2 family domain-containing protein [Colletotrichum scovillei]KAG7038607.1 SNF2 family domain-containing protein [Colletotrichum scovillei]KAG7040786.1 SNF2 family domain-containing protein [Colletotrichum scovillei]KAG7060830.1 SNF2 family domain-containing protein [Colletotrichum scovillei]
MNPSEESYRVIAETDRETSPSSHTTTASDQHFEDLFVEQEECMDRNGLDAPDSDSESDCQSLSDGEYSDDGSESEMREEDHQVTLEPTAKSKSQQRKRAPRRKNARDYVNGVVNENILRSLKKEIQKEIAKKRPTSHEALDIVPPKAKRQRRTRKISANTAQSTDHKSAPQASPDNSESVFIQIPLSQMKKVTNAQRQREITRKKNTGSNNRRSGTQAADLLEGIKVFGHGKVECLQVGEETRYGLKGMAETTKLLEPQIGPIAWMVKRENGLAPPYGGVLADDMGMGKTVVCLAGIVGNPPPETPSDGFSGATLVILPGDTTVRQWQQELSRHVECISLKEAYYYKRNNHATSGGDISRYKIVFTTYREVLQSLPTPAIMKKLEEDREADENFDYDTAFRAVAGEIFSVMWYRVVLDEAHEIKNIATRTFQACNHLTRKYIWLLSATPLINRGGDEMFAYVKTLRVEGMDTREDFREKYLGEDNSTALDALINVCTYRRTKQDEFLGEKILKQLMPFKSEVRWVKLFEQERLAYDLMTETYDKAKAEADTETISALNIRQMQIISHPYGVEKAFRNDLEPELLKFIFNGLSTRPINDGPTKGGFPTGEHLSLPQLLRYAHNEALMSPCKCGICGTDSIEEPHMINTCSHVFCRNCLLGTWQFKAQEGTCQEKGCKVAYEKETDVKRVLTLNSMEAECDRQDETEAATHASVSSQTPCSGRGAKKKRAAKSSRAAKDKQAKEFSNKKYGADYHGVLPALDVDDYAFIKQGMRENGGIVPLGAKLEVAKELIMQYQDERIRLWDETDKTRKRYDSQSPKTIVFHEFTKTAVILGITLNALGIPFVYLNGKVTPTQKNKAIDAFRDNKDIKVLISSVKTGGQGLNLTCASKIIRVDAWWNASVEQQADGRVHRIGQTQVASSVVIKAEDTIDNRILDMQEEKSEEIARILQDDAHETKLCSELELIKSTAPARYKELVRMVFEAIRREDNEADRL